MQLGTECPVPPRGSSEAAQRRLPQVSGLLQASPQALTATHPFLSLCPVLPSSYSQALSSLSGLTWRGRHRAPALVRGSGLTHSPCLVPWAQGPRQVPQDRQRSRSTGF